MATAFRAQYGNNGKDKKDIRCPCGGEVACGGTVHPLSNLGIGFRGGKFRVDKTYSRIVIGYSGFCFGCRREGHFILPEHVDKVPQSDWGK